MTAIELQRAMARIGELVEELERVPDIATRERARALLQTVLDVHRAGLARLLELVSANGPIEALAGDESVALLLSLHGLHPESVEARVRAAIGELAPRFLEQGVAVELTSVTDEALRVRLRTAGTLRADEAGLRAALEAAIRASAPEIAEVHIDGLDKSDVPVTRLGRRAPRG